MPSFEENTGAGNFLTNNCGSQQERYRDSSLRRFGKAQGCDERTDGRTDAPAMPKTREAFFYRA